MSLSTSEWSTGTSDTIHPRTRAEERRLSVPRRTRPLVTALLVATACAPRGPASPENEEPKAQSPKVTLSKVGQTPARLSRPGDLETINAHFTGRFPRPLAFRSSSAGFEVAEGCTLYVAPPKHRNVFRPQPESAAEALVPERDADEVTPVVVAQQDPDPARRLLATGRQDWAFPTTVVGGGACEDVTHAVASAIYGGWLDPNDAAGGPTCLTAEKLESFDSALETQCPLGPLFLHLRPVTLAPPGVERTPIVEPMLRIAGGSMDGREVREFWLDRDEVGDAAMQRCILAGACKQHEGETSGPFADGPALTNDENARAYCGWVGKRLPTLTEWRWAARGREEARAYPWGPELPDYQRVVARDAEHDEFVAVERHNNAWDPRMVLTRSEGRWYVRWIPAAENRDARPLGVSRDGLRHMVGNVAEVVEGADPDASRPLTAVGGSFRHLLPSHPEIALSGDPIEDEPNEAYRQSMLAVLSALGTGPNAAHVRGGRGARCAADEAPKGVALDAPRDRVGKHERLHPFGLRRFADARTQCVDAGFRLPDVAALRELLPAASRRGTPYWTVDGQRWFGGASAQHATSTDLTARTLCVRSLPPQ